MLFIHKYITIVFKKYFVTKLYEFNKSFNDHYNDSAIFVQLVIQFVCSN